jgi:hypothetical protein
MFYNFFLSFFYMKVKYLFAFVTLVLSCTFIYYDAPHKTTTYKTESDSLLDSIPESDRKYVPSQDLVELVYNKVHLLMTIAALRENFKEYDIIEQPWHVDRYKCRKEISIKSENVTLKFEFAGIIDSALYIPCERNLRDETMLNQTLG